MSWQPPPANSFKLNVDGSHLHGSGMSACGGLIQDASGHFVKGFYCNLGAATSVAGELWGLVLGLRLAHSLAIPVLQVEMDSRVVCNMIDLGQISVQPSASPPV